MRSRPKLTTQVAHGGSCDDLASSSRNLKLLNTNHGRIITDVTFDSPVLALKMNRHRLVVFLASRLIVFDMRSATELHTIPLKYTAKKGMLMLYFCAHIQGSVRWPATMSCQHLSAAMFSHSLLPMSLAKSESLILILWYALSCFLLLFIVRPTL
jgi:hypothetical protein